MRLVLYDFTGQGIALTWYWMLHPTIQQRKVIKLLSSHFLGCIMLILLLKIAWWFHFHLLNGVHDTHYITPYPCHEITWERILRAGPSLRPSVSSKCSSERRGSVSPSIMWSLNVCTGKWFSLVSVTKLNGKDGNAKRDTHLSILRTGGNVVDEVINIIDAPFPDVLRHLIAI